MGQPTNPPPRVRLDVPATRTCRRCGTRAAGTHFVVDRHVRTPTTRWRRGHYLTNLCGECRRLADDVNLTGSYGEQLGPC